MQPHLRAAAPATTELSTVLGMAPARDCGGLGRVVMAISKQSKLQSFTMFYLKFLLTYLFYYVLLTF